MSGAPVQGLALKNAWLVASIVLVLVVGIFLGIQIAHSNSDYVCHQAVSDTQTGACTGGSWSPWTTVNGTLTRTYTGTRTTITFSGTTVVSCSHPAPNIAAATGDITTAYAACQIVETGVVNNPTGNPGTPGNPANITSTSQTETTGEVSTSTQTTGSYTDYQNTVDDKLADASIAAAPSIVHPGDISTISWTSSHVKSCTVSGSNGDAWPKPTTQTTTDADGNAVQTPVTPSGITGSEKSKPIMQQTVYTLSCLTSIGRAITKQVTVTILPTFQEL